MKDKVAFGRLATAPRWSDSRRLGDRVDCCASSASIPPATTRPQRYARNALRGCMMCAQDFGNPGASDELKLENESEDPIETAVLTGFSFGSIGFEVAAGILRRNAACKLVVMARNEARLEDSLRRLKEMHPSAMVSPVVVQLESLKSVRAAAAQTQRILGDSNASLDALVNCAGVMACPEARTVERYEYQLGVNHLSHVLLTTSLLPALQRSQRQGGGRVVCVSSAAALFGDPHILLESDFRSYMPSNEYQRWPAYCTSKLANAVFARGLNDGDKWLNVTAVSVHPGVVFTNLAQHILPSWISNRRGAMSPQAQLNAARLFGLKTPSEGARVPLDAVLKTRGCIHPGAFMIGSRSFKLWPLSKAAQQAPRIQDHPNDKHNAESSVAVQFTELSIAEVAGYL